MKFNLIPILYYTILYYTILYYNYIYCGSYFIKSQNIMFALKTCKFKSSRNISFSENKLESDISNKLLGVLLWR